MVKHCLSLADLGAGALEAILEEAVRLKKERLELSHRRSLKGRSVAVVLEKPSTRTRLSFEVGIQELGAQPVVVMAEHSQLGRGETLEDTARMLSRFVHAVVCRTSAHQRLETLAAHASIPVINGLSDSFHPCQVLADLQTVRENFQTPWSELNIAWIGDGNNMARSWVVAAGLLGFKLTVASPSGFALDAAWAAKTGRGHVALVEAPEAAVAGAHVVTTDVWTSMGQEAETAARLAAFSGFEVNDALMAQADKSSIFLHCLPAHRGEEVSSAVIDGPRSRVWDEAENRLHAQKALLLYLMR